MAPHVPHLPQELGEVQGFQETAILSLPMGSTKPEVCGVEKT